MAAADFTRAAAKVSRLADEMGLAAGSGLRVIGEVIMTDVKASRPGRGVPVDTGALRSTGRVTGPYGIRHAVVRLSFGGAAAPYAVRQHEMEYRHTVGERRYLVRGVERYARGGIKVGRKALRENMNAALRRVARSA